MAQMEVYSWTNATPVAVRNQNVGFQVSACWVTNMTDGAQYYWNSAMPDGYYVTVSSGAVTTSNGFTPIAQSTLVAAPITAFSEAADAVITCSYLDQFDFAVGDTVKATDIADDLTGTTLNGTYTVKSVSATAITCEEDTSSGYATYVSGGYLSRVSDANGVPVPIENVAIQGITLGTGVVGTDGDSMNMVVWGNNPVT